MDVRHVLGTAGVQREQDQVADPDDRDLDPMDARAHGLSGHVRLPGRTTDDQVDRAVACRCQLHDTAEWIVGVAASRVNRSSGDASKRVPNCGVENPVIDGEEIDVESRSVHAVRGAVGIQRLPAQLVGQFHPSGRCHGPHFGLMHAPGFIGHGTPHRDQ